VWLVVRPRLGRSTLDAPADTCGRGAKRRIAAASAFGSTIGYCAFFLYGTASAVVFPEVFFPDATPITLDRSRTMILSGIIVANVLFIGLQVGAGALSDRVGRRPVYIGGRKQAAEGRR